MDTERMVTNIDDKGAGNQVLGQPSPESVLSVTFLGNGNTLEIGENVHILLGSIIFRAHEQKVTLVGSNRLYIEIHMSGSATKLRIGRGTKSNALVWMNLGEDGDRVTIGENCLFSAVRIRTSDSHPIYDMGTGERINPSGHVEIGDRVWAAEDVLMLKGAKIGSGSAIGARSTVIGDIPENALCVGTPARVIRENIRWSERFPK